MKKYLAPVAVAALLTLAGCAGGKADQAMSPAMTPSDAMSPSAMMTPSEAMTPGEGMTMSPSEAMTGEAMTAASPFVTYADYEAAKDRYADTTVVLFFNAKWCPACRAITEDLTADASRLPEKTTIVSVDYDEHTELRQRYGVTMQHTFVSIDDQGQQLRKWTSTSTDALVKELQG
ncbi:MAG: thioredoxin domain-containing protein [Propionibacteriaceae bacterium]|nr:thioredoxin domain-containing protein [Propionibacteriaceae bacterium]